MPQLSANQVSEFIIHNNNDISHFICSLMEEIQTLCSLSLGSSVMHIISPSVATNSTWFLPTSLNARPVIFWCPSYITRCLLCLQNIRHPQFHSHYKCLSMWITRIKKVPDDLKSHDLTLLLLLLVYVSWTIIGQPWNSIFIHRV